jgi:hypothetical protein
MKYVSLSAIRIYLMHLNKLGPAVYHGKLHSWKTKPAQYFYFDLMVGSFAKQT